jgi:PAS domain S-box-containing protein
MTAPPPQVGSLAELLESRREDILQRWLESARHHLPAERLSRPELVNGLPDFLDEVAFALRRPVPMEEMAPSPGVTHMASEHGKQRFRVGASINAVVREYGLLRSVLFDFMEETGCPVRLSELRVLTQAITTGIAEAISHYAALRERALKESEERFRLLVEGVEEYAIFMLDAEGRVASWNPGAQRIKGWREEEVLGQPYAIFYPPEGVAAGLPQRVLQEAAAQGRYVVEGLRVRKDGSRFWADAVLTALKDESGHLRGFAKVTRDITERKKAEAERERLVKELQEAVRARDEFLSVAAHELRTPLTPLHLKVQGLMREAEASQGSHLPTTRVLQSLSVAEAQVRRLKGLVNNLLDVARLSQGRLPLTLEEVDLCEVVRDVTTVLAPDVQRTGSPLHVTADGAVVGTWDRLRLEQVLTNLLTNAMRYGAGRPIEVEVEARSDCARLVVRDFGIGIQPEALARIFGKFERAVSERHYGGLGLGLFITRQIVEALGGTIRAESIPGKGATFTVALPRQPQPSSREAATPG